MVVDTRRSHAAAIATLHLMLLPGPDIALCNGLLHRMLWGGWTASASIAAHTSGCGSAPPRNPPAALA